jgi:hypothetical protein
MLGMKLQFTLQRLFLVIAFCALGMSFGVIRWRHDAFLHFLFASPFFFGIAIAGLFVRPVTQERALKMTALYLIGCLFFVSRWPMDKFLYLVLASQFCFGASVGILIDRPLVVGFAFAVLVWYVTLLWIALHPQDSLPDFTTPLHARRLAVNATGGDGRGFW